MLIGVVIGTLFGLGTADLDRLWALFPKGTSVTDWIVAVCTTLILVRTWQATSYTKRIWLNDRLFLLIDDLQHSFDDIKFDVRTLIVALAKYQLNLHSKDMDWKNFRIINKDIKVHKLISILVKLEKIVEGNECKKFIYVYIFYLRSLEITVNKVGNYFEIHHLSIKNRSDIIKNNMNELGNLLDKNLIENFPKFRALLYSEIKRL